MEKISKKIFRKKIQKNIRIFLLDPHCLGRVNKKNEMFLGRDCQNPNILVITYNISKIQKILARFFGEITIWSFFLIKLHVTERQKSLNEVCEGVTELKNHTKKFCWPWAYFASKMSLLYWFDQMVQKKAWFSYLLSKTGGSGFFLNHLIKSKK